MSSLDDHRMGITPIVMRRAAYYLSLGVGEYFPDHPHFDRVTVEQIYAYTPAANNGLDGAVGLRVSFFQNTVRTRWVEFSCSTVGAGGEPLLREVHED